MAAGVVSYMLGVVFYAGLVSLPFSSYPSPCLGILYKTLLAENCQNLKMATKGQNM